MKGLYQTTKLKSIKRAKKVTKNRDTSCFFRDFGNGTSVPSKRNKGGTEVPLPKKGKKS